MTNEAETESGSRLRRTPSLLLLTEEEPLRECDSVALASLQHVGKAYKITRELTQDFVDCSTLVSQAHWIGGGVQTPFIAETQRLAANGTPLALKDILPGDLLFAYASKHASPDGKHNHVAMYVGPDEYGTDWVIESRPGSGVLFSPLRSVSMAGGIRRFCPHPTERFASGAWQATAKQVPKLGRLGARLTARYTQHTRHRGLDVYVPDSSEVVSPVDGLVVSTSGVSPQAVSVDVMSADGRILTKLAPLARTTCVSKGEKVRQGERLGQVSVHDVAAACNRVPANQRVHQARLHWELWMARANLVSSAPDLEPPSGFPRGSFMAQNPVYWIKMGVVRSPFDSDCP